MAKKKNITQEQLVTMYMEYMLEQNKKPETVYAFAKENNFEEALFYNHFGDFEAIEKLIFKLFHHNTVTVLEANEDYQSFDAKNKLLTYYYTLFENLTANRSYVKFFLEQNKNALKTVPALSEWRKEFKSYIEHMEFNTIDLKEERLEEFQSRSIEELSWVQLMLTLKFWLDDSSAGFEKTDLFIEKSINATFDFFDPKPIKNLIDFGKFLVKEKVKF